MSKIFGWLAILIIVIIGGWYWYSTNADSAAVSDAMGSYAYMCDTGTHFTMAPSADLSAITVTPGEGAAFGETTLSFVSGDVGQRYEGGGMVFIGAGEGVTVTQNGITHVCEPVPSTDMAPWNWGDAGEGGSIKPELSLVVGESIVGKWQSTDDAKFVREFKDDDTVIDYYDGEVTSSGLWLAFTKQNAPKIIAFPIEEDTAYIQMTETGSQDDTLNFKVVKLTPDELVLIYMERGGTLTFKAVQ